MSSKPLPQPDLLGVAEIGGSAPSQAARTHQLGHRERLRERAALGGLGALPDYELLELYLFRTLPRGDVKPLAKALIARFGDLNGVLAAPQSELQRVAGVGEAAAIDLKLVQAFANRLAAGAVARRPIISSWTALLTYVRTHMQHEPREQFRVLFLDRKNQLVQDEVMGHGTVDQAPVYPREIVRRALELSSSAVILVHNHPSGDPTPSRADIEMTKEVVAAAKALRIEVHDHLIVGREGVTSFKERGLL